MDPEHRQRAYRVRLEQGPTGALAVADGADLAVVVDVLSFTTTLSVACARGITVLPCRWRDDGAVAYAAAHDAVLAVGRLESRRLVDGGGAAASLSPAVMARLDPGALRRIVLPSPNGSSISVALRESGALVVAACLRNRTAVAQWLAPRLREGATVAVVAAGERWPDGSLRPAVEDLWGAGALLAALLDVVEPAGLGPEALGPEALSPEARAAVAAYRDVEAHLGAALEACASGRELIAAGFGDDVTIAASLDVDEGVVPVLAGEEFSSTAG